MAGPIVESQRRAAAAGGPRQAVPRLRLMEAREAQLAVEFAPGQRHVCDCIIDVTRHTYFILVKNIRDTLYGHVALYQVGKLEEDGIVRPTNLAQGKVAIKVCAKDLVERRVTRQGARVQEDPIRELSIQQRLSEPGHRFVLTLLTCLESPGKIFAVYPFVGGGELFDMVSANAPIPEVGARALMRGMIESIIYCHSAGVSHRDVSLENFMLGGDHNQSPVLIDFGLAVVMDPAGVSPEGEQLWAPIPHSGPVGKTYYMAPEVYTRLTPAYSGTIVDTWSVAVSLFIMLTGVPPWEMPTTMDGRFRTIVMEQRLMDLLRQWRIPVSVEAGDLLQRVFVLDPARRLTLREMMRHPWLRG